MPKAVQAPHGFVCPYRQACPHLEGLSTHWVWECYQEHPWERLDLLQQIDGLGAELKEAYRSIGQLKRENAQLQAQLHALHRAQFKANRPESKAPPDPQLCEPVPKKKRGAPVGHPPWTRPKPQRVDQVVPVAAPKACPHCDCRQLQGWPQRCQHLQEDIVLCPKTVVVCFDHEQAWCPNCRRPVVQGAPGELIGAYIGPVAKSAAVYLRYGIGLSYRNVRKIFTELFGLSMVPASVVGFDRRACAKAEALYADLHQKIQASAYLHADETSWRVDGSTHWLWYAGHEQLAYFHIDRYRSGAVAATVIGPRFAGVLNADDYAAYNAAPAQARQSCLAHPLRKARDLLQSLAVPELAGQVPLGAQRFLQQTKAFLKEACELGRQLRQGQGHKVSPQRLEQKCQQRLGQICARRLSWEPAEELRCRLRRQRDRLFTFLRHPQVQPTNNQAEQSLRRSVILRKITFGNRSDAGAHRQAVLSSLTLTAQRQGRDARAAFQTLFTQPLAVAQKAFYQCRKPKLKKNTPARCQKRNRPRRPKGKDPPK